MIIQPTAKLAFQSTELDVYDLNGTRWMGCPQIADALGMRDRRAVNDIYKRHKSEFTPAMTGILTVPSISGAQQTRVFSPEGVIRICMLAKSERAAAFRDWATEVLMGRAAPMQPSRHLPALPEPPEPLVAARDELLRAKPRWAAIARYVRLGLTNTEIARLLRLQPKAIAANRRRMEACAILPPPAQLGQWRQAALRLGFAGGRTHG